MPQPESETFQHYQVLRRPDGSLHELGRGAMGITYKAFDTNLRSYVALKVVNSLYLNSDTARARFLREARAAAALRHRNVASVYHLGNDDQSFFYAMEFVEGETVAALIERTGPLPVATAMSIVLQVARALGAAHRQNLIHRDIKPANLMVTREDDDEDAGDPDEEGSGSTMTAGEASALHVKVIDFGLARSSLDAAGSSSGPITMGGFVGTAQFASPEQLEEKEVDIRSDIYSLGITLWFLLAGRAPFTGSMFSLYSQHLTKEPPWEQLGDRVPASLREILARMLQKNPADRYQTPAALRRALENGLTHLAGTGAAPGAPAFRPRPGDSPSEGGGTRSSSVTGSQSPPSEELAPTMIAETIVTPPSAVPASEPVVPASETGPARPGAILAGRYRLDEFLGEGGSGRTFRATDIANGVGSEHLVALKLAWPGKTSSPEVEARLEEAAARLRAAPHPALLAVENAGRHGDLLFLVNEWVRGFTVLDLLRARGRLPAAEALALLGPAAAAADHARSHELDGFDLTPRSVFVHFPDAQDAPAARRFLQVPLRAWPGWMLKAPAIALPPHEHSSGSSAAGEGVTWAGEMTIVAASPAAARAATAGPRSAREMIAAVARLAHELLDGAPPDPNALLAGRFTSLPAFNEAANDVLRLALLSGRGDAPPPFAGAGAFREALARAAGLEGGGGRSIAGAGSATMAPPESRVPVAVTSAGATILRDSPTVSAAAAPPPSAVPEPSVAAPPPPPFDPGGSPYPPPSPPRSTPWVPVSIAALLVGLGAIAGTVYYVAHQPKPIPLRISEVTPEPTVQPTAPPSPTPGPTPTAAPTLAPTVPPGPTPTPPPSGPRSLRVPGAYATIQAAMEAARPGDTVQVGPGNYRGPVVFKEGVRLLGENPETCLIVGVEDENVPALLRVADCRVGSVENLGLRGAGNVGPLGVRQDGILLSNSSITVFGCRVSAMSNSGIVVFDAASRPTIKNNRSTSNGRDGMSFERGAGGSAEGNILEGNEQCGIIVADRGSAPELRKNECRDNRRHGLNFLRGSGGLAESNLLERNTGSGIAVDGNDTVPLLRENRVLNNRSHGIGYARSAGGTAENNVVEGNTGNGIFVYGADTAPELRSNKSLRNRQNGLEYGKGAVGTASENVLEGNEGCGILVADPLTSPSLLNNTVSKNRQFGIASKNAPDFKRIDPSNKLVGNALGPTTKQ